MMVRLTHFPSDEAIYVNSDQVVQLVTFESRLNTGTQITLGGNSDVVIVRETIDDVARLLNGDLTADQKAARRARRGEPTDEDDRPLNS